MESRRSIPGICIASIFSTKYKDDMGFQQHNLRKAAFFQILAWFFFAAAYLVSKMITFKTTVPMMLLFRGLIPTLLLLPIMMHRGWQSFRVSAPGWLIARCFVTTATITFIFLSVRTIPLVDTTLLANSAPFFVPFLVFALMKKPIDHRLWLPIAFGFIGVIFILRPTPDLLRLGALFALGSGISTALAGIISRELIKKVSSQTMLFNLFLFSLLVSIPFAVFYWELSQDTILPLVLIGVFILIAQWAFFRSFAYAEASYVAPFGYASVFFGGLFDWMFFGDFPHPLTWVGMILVIASGIWILRQGRLQT